MPTVEEIIRRFRVGWSRDYDLVIDEPTPRSMGCDAGLQVPGYTAHATPQSASKKDAGQVDRKKLKTIRG
jgi:hypothetical protein